MLTHQKQLGARQWLILAAVALLVGPVLCLSPVEEAFVPVGKGVLIQRDPANSGRGTVVALGETATNAGKVGDTVAVDVGPCDGLQVKFNLASGGAAQTYCSIPAGYVFGAISVNADSTRIQSLAKTPQPVLLRGRVIDALTGLPITTAAVTIVGATGSVIASQVAVDRATGFFELTTTPTEGDTYTVTATAPGYLTATGAPFPAAGPSAPAMNDFLISGGLDIALAKASDIPANGLLTAITWTRRGTLPTFFVDGAWQTTTPGQGPGQGTSTQVTDGLRGIERLSGGTFHEIITDRTTVGTVRFVLDLFWFYNGDAQYASSHVQVFFYTRSGLLRTVRGPFDETSLLGATYARAYPFWHVAEYSAAADTITPVLPAKLRLDPSAGEIINADLPDLAPEWFP